ncbi:MAG: hypothetical protein MJ236_01165 [Clostridia bacterium]|nr:hypothetical protein [Clostridia bacterium]
MEYIRLDVGTSEIIDLSYISSDISVISTPEVNIEEYLDIYDMSGGTFEIYALKPTKGSIQIDFEAVLPSGQSQIITYSVTIDGVEPIVPDEPEPEPNVKAYINTSRGWKEAEVCAKKVQGFLILESKLKEQRSWK